MNTRPTEQPLANAASVQVNLIGGPECGSAMNLGEACHQIDLPDGSHYRYCPHASARLGHETFLHSTLDAYLYAR